LKNFVLLDLMGFNSRSRFGDSSNDLYLELETNLKSFIKRHVSAPLNNCIRHRQSLVFSCFEVLHVREKGERKVFLPVEEKSHGRRENKILSYAHTLCWSELQPLFFSHVLLYVLGLENCVKENVLCENLSKKKSLV
jgi:hypothetical protein